jgi:hypothetical protein
MSLKFKIDSNQNPLEKVLLEEIAGERSEISNFLKEDLDEMRNFKY